MRRRVLAATLAVLLAGLVGWSAAIVAVGDRAVPDWLVPAVRPTAQEREALAYDDVQDTARAFMAAFLKVDYQNMDPITDKVLSLTAEPLRSQYETARVQIKALAQENQSKSSGTVRSVGVGEVKGGDAVAFVAADSTLTNKSTKTPQEVRLRLKLTLVREGGDWKVSEVVFFQ